MTPRPLLPSLFRFTFLSVFGVLLSGCGLSSVSRSTATETTTLQISGSVHGGQQPISGATVQLWETGLGASTATATATVAGGGVTSFVVSNQGRSGSGYTTAPAVMVTGGGGMDAAGTATISNGYVASITLVNGGSGYTSAPTVTIAPPTSTGYGSGTNATLVDSTTTAMITGAFTFPRTNVAGNCTTGPFSYLTATGGDATGNTLTNVNPNIQLVAIIGACNTTGAGTYVIVNELTTVAAAYAVGNFATDYTTSSAAGNISIGAPSSNAQGLADAVANAVLLVNPAYGQAANSTASVLLPTTMVNTLGTILATCVNSSGPSSTQCTNLMAYATPPGSSTTPADTFQAALNMAKYPGNNVAGLMNLPSPYTAFSPTFSYSPATGQTQNDLSLGIAFPIPGQISATTGATSLVIDANDNVFALGASNSTATKPRFLAGVSSSSAGATMTTGFFAATVSQSQVAAIDLSNNIYMTDQNSPDVYELPNENASNLTTLVLTSPDGKNPNTDTSAEIAQNTWGLAVDGSGNVFTSSYRTYSPVSCVSAGTAANTRCEVQEYTTGSTPAVYSFSGAQAYTDSVRGMAADSNTATAAAAYKGNVWFANTGDNTVGILKPSTGAVATATVGGSATQGPLGIALDAGSNAWVTTNRTSGLFFVSNAGATGVAATAYTPNATNAGVVTGIQSTSTAPASAATTAVPVGGINSPRYLAVDGAGNVFVANNGYSSVVEYSPSYNNGGTLGAYLSPNYGFAPSIGTITSAKVTKYAIAGNVLTLTSANTFSAGQTVTLGGFPVATFLNGQTVKITTATSSSFTAPFTYTPVSSTTESGAALAPSTVAQAQALFTCTGTTTVTCSITSGAYASAYPVAVDRTGAIWTVNGSTSGAVLGNIVEILGPGAPTNPVLAAGAYGVLP